MAGPSMRPGRRAPAYQNALFELSVLCSQSGQGGMATEALELILAANGLERGGLFDLEGGELSLVCQWGMPRALRAGLEAVAVGEQSWFPGARCAVRRKLMCSRPGIGGPVLPDAMVMAGWGTMCAVPILIGRRAIGVMVFAADTEEVFDDDARVFLQTAAGMLAVTFALKREQERARDAAEGVGWRKGSGSRGRAVARERAAESERFTESQRTAVTKPPPRGPQSSRSGSSNATARLDGSRRKGSLPAPPVKARGDEQDRKDTVQNLRLNRQPTAATIPEMGAARTHRSEDDKKTLPPAARRRASVTRGGRPSAKKTAVDIPAQKRRDPPKS